MRFIELTHETGTRIKINVRQIVYFSPSEDEGTEITLDPDWELHVRESYEMVVDLIKSLGK
jgi:hypothetical protein